MRKIFTWLIVINIFSFSLFSSILCKNNITKDLEKDIEKIENNINVLRETNSIEGKINLYKTEITHTLAKYKLNNKDVVYIDDAINEIGSIKYSILKNNLLLQGYNENQVSKNIDSYISNKTYDVSEIYNLDMYSNYIEKLLTAVRSKNIENYKKTKQLISNDLLSKIDIIKIELKKQYDKTQDFSYIDKIQKLINKEEEIKNVNIKYINNYEYQIKYTVLNLIVTLILIKIYLTINKKKSKKNRRKKINGRRKIRIERNNRKNKIKKTIFITTLIVLSNIICIVGMIL